MLDEPTEGLDSDTERDVFTALADFAGDKTVIMVTHREAGLGLVDSVYKMEQGVLRALWLSGCKDFANNNFRLRFPRSALSICGLSLLCRPSRFLKPGRSNYRQDVSNGATGSILLNSKVTPSFG